jgi:N-acylneuraminate cytidylyltransferase
MTEVLAIVPARGGSKGIPRKNIREFAGHPLLAYSIAAGLQAETVTRTIVSTDDEEIAAVARNYGAQVPFLRPPELAEDDTTDLPVFQHALAGFKNTRYRPESLCSTADVSATPAWLVDRAVRSGGSRARIVCLVWFRRARSHKMWRLAGPAPQ